MKVIISAAKRNAGELIPTWMLKDSSRVRSSHPQGRRGFAR